MTQASQRKDELVVLFNLHITTFPPMYPEAKQVLIIRSPALYEAPLVGIMVCGEREVFWVEECPYQNTPDNMDTIGQWRAQYIESVNDWWLAEIPTLVPFKGDDHCRISTTKIDNCQLFRERI